MDFFKVILEVVVFVPVLLSSCEVNEYVFF